MKRRRFDSIATTIALTIVIAMDLGFALQRAVDAGLEYVGFSARRDVQMLAAMSHDLRTSLTRLKLRLEIGENQEQQQKRMIVEFDAMSAMIGSILSFARDDIRREPRKLVDLDAWLMAFAKTPRTPAGP